MMRISRPRRRKGPDKGGREKGPGPSDILKIISRCLRRASVPFAYLGGLPFIPLGHVILQGRIRCPGCGGWIALDAERCPVCGRSIASDGSLWSDPKRAMSPLNEVRADIRFPILGSAIIVSIIALVLRPIYWFLLPAAFIASIAFSLYRVRKLLKGEKEDW
jgi:hypothetical protein